MLQNLIWHFRYFWYCYKISKQRDVLDFFLSLEEGAGRKYNVNVRQLNVKVKKASAKGYLKKTTLMQSEMYNVLNGVEDENFADEITVLALMLILWGMQRSSKRNKE